MIRKFLESLRKFIEEICCVAHERGIPFPKRPWRKYRAEVENGRLDIRFVETDWKPDLSAFSERTVGLNTEESRVFGDLIEIIERSEKLSRVFLTDNAGNPLPKELDKRQIKYWVLSRLLPIIRLYFSEVGSFDFSSRVFSRVCDRLEREIEQFPRCERILLCPLVGVHVAEGCCFQLEDDLRIRSLSQEEIEELFNECVPYYPGPNFSTVIEVRRIIEAFNAISFPLEDSRRIECLVTALRLLSGERVFVPFQVEKNLGVLKIPFEKASFMSLEQRIVPVPGRLYILNERDRAEVEEMYRCMSEFLLDSKSGKIDLDTKLKRRVALALRKYSECLDQTSHEWKLIASWTALEALFSPSDQSELSFRLALRAATFLGQKEVYQKLKNSYRIRCKIVHGRSSSEDEVKSAVTETEEVLSQVLRKILQEPESYTPDQLEEKLLQNLTAGCT
ncbi:hypothetical protein Adeg_0825 [Ammonifex degensii KC4]|uniref:Uncharacterized protein n=1 Tax=Ammonifex degensii (strain DSM 10501 / KC4) TaxID=429009 RepID=C9RCI9_AMMDK|nr:HEPN domain-containing protein [Ammonifex degensii]ACX51966.1 hypothetical protein Adeg_0825 [Ammonifex degensii KC4]